MYIETINSPEDVKKLTIEELPALAEEMAAELGAGNKKPEILPKLAQYELTLLDPGKPAWRTFRTKFRNGGSDHCHALCI